MNFMPGATLPLFSRRYLLLAGLTVILVILACPGGVYAQFPHPAGVGPDVEVGAGYAYVNMEIPGAGRLNLNGVEASVTANVTPRFGIRGDFSYATAPNTLDAAHGSNVMSGMGGGVAYLARKKSFTVYAEGLIGGARVYTVVPSTNGSLAGTVSRFAYAAGGGVQYRFSPRISFRFGADYYHTQFAQSFTTFQGQNNLRAVVSLVYHFSSR